MVETALVMPVVFVLIFGCIDFSRYLYARATLEGHARDGARMLTLERHRSSDCSALTVATSSGGGISLDVDPSSVWNNASSSSTSPSTNRGLVYIYPAVAQSPSAGSPGCQAASGNRRPSGSVSVTITYNFAPWTPLIGSLTGPLMITAQSQEGSEY
jgi:Flp pilus assembly protein TadG